MADPIRKNSESIAPHEADIQPTETTERVGFQEVVESADIPKTRSVVDSEPVQPDDEQAVATPANLGSETVPSPEAILSSVPTVQEIDAARTAELLKDENKLDPGNSGTAHQMLEDIINDR